MIKGVKDLSNLTQEQLEEKYLESAMWCDAHDCLKKRREFNKFSTNIEIANVRGPSLALNIGSCDTSTLHFWVGVGVIEIRKNRMLQRIMSQFSLDKLIETGVAKFHEVDSPFKGISNVFSKIPIWSN